MKGGSLRRYMSPSYRRRLGLQRGNGLEGLVIPAAKDVVRDAWRASVQAIGGPEVLKRAVSTFKKTATKSAKAKLNQTLRKAGKQAVKKRTVKRAKDIFGL